MYDANTLAVSLVFTKRLDNNYATAIQTHQLDNIEYLLCEISNLFPPPPLYLSILRLFSSSPPSRALFMWFLYGFNSFQRIVWDLV